jgi:hypothetical protein
MATETKTDITTTAGFVFEVAGGVGSGDGVVAGDGVNVDVDVDVDVDGDGDGDGENGPHSQIHSPGHGVSRAMSTSGGHCPKHLSLHQDGI